MWELNGLEKLEGRDKLDICEVGVIILQLFFE
jgi:hypothetical protein